MSLRRTCGAMLAVVAVGVAMPTAGQAANGKVAAPLIVLSAQDLHGAALPAMGEFVREIDDPHTGDRWLLTRDAVHPEGPGRLILAARRSGVARQERHPGSAQAAELQPERALPKFVIHAGDRLIVEESSAVVDAHLEAKALGPAAQGSTLNVRLTMGGKVVRAVALGPGRAAFIEDAEVRP